MLGIEAALALTLLLLLMSLFSGYPVGVCLGGTGILAPLLIGGLSAIGVLDASLMPDLARALEQLALLSGNQLSSHLFAGSLADSLLAIPLFILIGALLANSGVMARLFAGLQALFAGVKPLNLPTVQLVLTGGLMAASSGVVAASVSTLARVGMAPLIQAGVSQRQSAGLIMATGTLAQLIPPSISAILLAAMINTYYSVAHPGEVLTVNQLFLGAILPGAALLLAFVIYASVQGLAAKSIPSNQPPSRLALCSQLLDIAGPLVLILVVLGSIFGGLASPTVAAGLGVLVTLCLAAGRAGLAVVLGFAVAFTLLEISNLPPLIGWLALAAALTALVVMSLAKAKRQALGQSLVEAGIGWANIALILVGATIFNLGLKSFGADLYLQELASLTDQPWQLFLLLLLVFFVLGFVMEFVELVALLIPLVGPILFASDLDPVWVGVSLGLVVQTSFLTPPLGLALFYFRSQVSMPTGALIGGVLPYVVIQLAVLALVLAFPALTTWLPDLLLR